MTGQRHVIVGGGVAAASAAASLRSHGFDGEVVIVSVDEVLPYERPPLSKQFLVPTTPPEPTYMKPEDWYADHDVQVLLGVRANTLDPVGKTQRRCSGVQLWRPPSRSMASMCARRIASSLGVSFTQRDS